jgi:hypothetical protein
VTQAATRATLPVLRALLDQAQRKDYQSGVLGVRARPGEWRGPDTFTHAGVAVRVVPCVSTLAVREALLERIPGQWLVVLTDRPEDDLGAGVLSHLVGHRLRTPDPWDAVRLRFAATGVDPALTSAADDREIAVGLLAASPQHGWPPAPGGVLTRDHALGAVAAEHLGLTDSVVDGTSVLAWTADPSVAARVADLRALAGDTVTSAVLAWAASRAGAARSALHHLLRTGEGRDAVPLGLVVGVLGAVLDLSGNDATPPTPESVQLAREALIRLEPRFGGTAPSPAALRSWSREAATVAAGLLTDPATGGSGEILLARADEFLDSVRAAGLADASDLLPAGLTRRLAALAEALRAALIRIESAGDARKADPDRPRVRPASLADVEKAWGRVAEHRLSEEDARTRAFHAAVRLARWLTTDAAVAGTSLSALLGRHRDSDSWVDSAVNEAARGASDPELGAGLAAVLTDVRKRRDAHDAAFAAALAAHTRDDPGAVSGLHAGVRHLEDLLPGVVLPLARSTPVLLLVLDGMSAGVGVDVAAGVLSRTAEGWAEALLPGESRRAAALAVLPTLTEVSRTSLLCGGLRTGGQGTEQRGYEELWRAHGLPGAALFHKKPLDSSRLGYAVADDVAAAIADVVGRPLVTCVLNTIDDALDRSDPGGTDWGTDAVKHLSPLLDRARYAGRVVILTADHGHIVERREGTQRTYAAISSGRSRAAIEPAADGEVLVTGPRVLPDHAAVLAVDERLRYGPLKAGYHGGGAPAEAVVPVAVFVPGMIPSEADLHLAPPQEPTWWIDPAAPALPAPDAATVTESATPGITASRPAADLRRPQKDATPSLFDEPAGERLPAAAEGIAAPPDSVSAAVLKSPVYAAQKKIAGRVSVADDQIGRLLGALLAAPGHRLVPARAATALAVPTATLRGAVLHAQRLLNVEGYPVLRIDADGSTVILDEALLREQFGIRG